MKLNVVISIILLGTGCFSPDCDKETDRIEALDYNFVITKKHIDNSGHHWWIEGVDTLGNNDTFEFYGFSDLVNLAESGDFFYKEKGSLEMRLKRQNLVYVLLWECHTAGSVIRIDTLK